MKLVHFTLLVLFCGIFICDVRAQFPVRNLTVDDGLPTNSIWSIAQDHQGFMWFGTYDGLCRYDGFDFKIFKNNPEDSNSISGNYRHEVYVAHDGKIWTAHNNGVSVYDPAKNIFHNLFTYAKKPDNDMLSRIAGEDAHGNIFIWVANEGLMQVDARTLKRIAVYNFPNDESDKCLSAVLTKNGDVWFSLEKLGLYCWNSSDKKFTHHIAQYFPETISLVNDSEIIAGCYFRKFVLYHFKSGIVEELKCVDAQQKEIPFSDQFLSITESAPGVFLISTRAGFVEYHLGDIILHPIFFNEEDKESSVYTNQAALDQSGNIWLATNGEGVKIVLTHSRKFHTLQPTDSKNAIAKSFGKAGKNLVVGYFQSGVDVYDSSMQLLRHFDNSNSNLPSNSVFSLAPVDENSVLLSVIYSLEVGIFNFKTGKYESLLPELEKAFSGFGKINHTANFILQSGAHEYIINRNQYLFKIIIDGEKRSAVLLDSIQNQLITCVFIDNKKQLWCGTFSGVYVKQNNNWKNISLPVSEIIKCIAQTPDGKIWISSVRGIFVFDNEVKLQKWFNEKNELVNEYVYSLLPQPNGDVWFSHNKGVSCYIAAEKIFRNYSKTDGLQSNEFNTGAFYQSPDGNIFFGGVRGANYFLPSDIKNNSSVGITNLISLLVNDEEFALDSSLSYLHSLNLNYEQNTLSFRFASCEFTNPLLNKFKYRLKNYDKDWVDAGTTRSVRYANIPPGNYLFEVKSCNNDGVWNNTAATVHINIIPPYWQTWWFRILAVIFVVGIISAIVFYLQRLRYQKQLRAIEVQKKLQDERERISRDLHDNVGTQLSLISNNIDWVTRPLKELSDKEKNMQLEYISNTSRDVIATLRETIWAINKSSIGLEEFSDKLKAHIQKQIALISEVKFFCHEKINHAVELSPSETLNLFRICQEAVANSLKYAECTELNVTLETYSENKFMIQVSDNGKGFTNENHGEEHYGITNMQFRAREMGTELRVNSSSQGITIEIIK